MHKKHLIDGEPVPSVTTVTGLYTHPALLYWYGKNGTQECNRIKRESAEFGDQVHEGVYEFFKTGTIPKKVNEKLLSIRQTFLIQLVAKWAEESKFTPEALEFDVLSKEDRYGGTSDVRGTFGSDTTKWILDWKTSNQLDTKMRLQVAAYAKAYNEEHKLDWGDDGAVNNGGIIRLAKEPSAVPQFEVATFNDLSRSYPGFKALRTFYDYLNVKGQFKDLPKIA